MNKKILFLFFLTLLIYLIIYPLPFKDITQQIITLFFTFYIPALFPTIFLINMVFKTNVLQNLSLKHKRLADILISILIIFGGTPTFLSLKNELDMEKNSLQPILFIGPSFSYVYFIFYPLLKYQAFLLAFTSISIRLILFILLNKKLELKINSSNQSLYQMMISTSKNTLISIFNLILIILSLNMLSPLLQKVIISDDLILLFNGIIEYSFNTPNFFKLSNILFMAGFFIMEFNGLCSFLAVKKSYPKINLFKIIPLKILLSLFISGISILVFKEINNALWY